MIADRAMVDGLKSKLRGPVIGPNDASYDAARKVYNAMIDRYPAVIDPALIYGW